MLYIKDTYYDVVREVLGLVHLFFCSLQTTGQNIEQEMDNLNIHAEEDGAEEEREQEEQEEGVMVVPVVDVGAAAAALQGEIVALQQQDIIPVPPALLEPLNNQVRSHENSAGKVKLFSNGISYSCVHGN